ncbi:MAG: cupin domain-containing protein [Actinobacteria bacterium]|nr:cupin domain-containing protein [Actinomycetota bacterium]
MLLISHDNEPWEEWRPGVHSRAWATASNGACQVRIAEQKLEPGCEAPPHWHYFEENITVVAGLAELSVGEETAEVGPGNTVIVPATARHGFRSVGDVPLHVIASMGWPINEINYESNPDEIWRAGERVGDGSRRRMGLMAGAVQS